MSLRSINTFYFKFIKLTTKLEFIKKILLQKFIYKLLLRIQHQMKSELNYLDNIKDLAIHCKKIYDQIIATNHINSNTK